MFAIRKFKEDPGAVTAVVTGKLERVEKRWRIPALTVHLQLGNAAENIPHLQRAIEQFEDFCVVTQSVRNGIEVKVEVSDTAGSVVSK